MKEIKIAGAIGNTDRQNRDSSRVIIRGGYKHNTEIRDLQGSSQSDKKVEKRMIIVGAIGYSERKNRDDFRVMSGNGIICTLQSHVYKMQPLVMKKWKRNVDKLE